jgi:hypothetical protein
LHQDNRATLDRETHTNLNHPDHFATETGSQKNSGTPHFLSGLTAKLQAGIPHTQCQENPPVAEKQADGDPGDEQPFNLVDSIREQIHLRRQFVFEELDRLDRHERSLENSSIAKTLELLGEYVLED